jgi:hypothetical protein
MSCRLWQDCVSCTAFIIWFGSGLSSAEAMSHFVCAVIMLKLVTASAHLLLSISLAATIVLT